MKKFDVEVRKTISRDVFLEAETEEEAMKIGKEKIARCTDLNVWQEHPSESRIIVTLLLAQSEEDA